MQKPRNKFRQKLRPSQNNLLRPSPNLPHEKNTQAQIIDIFLIVTQAQYFAEVQTCRKRRKLTQARKYIYFLYTVCEKCHTSPNIFPHKKTVQAKTTPSKKHTQAQIIIIFKLSPKPKILSCTQVAQTYHYKVNS